MVEPAYGVPDFTTVFSAVDGNGSKGPSFARKHDGQSGHLNDGIVSHGLYSQVLVSTVCQPCEYISKAHRYRCQAS